MTQQSRLGVVPEQFGKAPVRVETDVEITLSGLQTVNGVALQTNDRVLVKDQTDATQNGIYDAKPEAWERSADFERPTDVYAYAGILSQETGIFYYVDIPAGTYWNPDATAVNFGLVSVLASMVWGGITGTLANQTDLQAALDSKADAAATATALDGKIGGSIADNQIAVGAATADEIEGDADLTWDGTEVKVAGDVIVSRNGTANVKIDSPNSGSPFIELQQAGATRGFMQWVDGNTNLRIQSDGPIDLRSNNAVALILDDSQVADFANRPTVGAEQLAYVSELGGGPQVASGTFTPTLIPIGAGSITLNSGLDLLSWYRVGELVHVKGRILVSSVSAPSGDLQLNVLPFQPLSETEGAGQNLMAVFADGITGTTVNAPQKGDFAIFTGFIVGGIGSFKIRDGLSGDAAGFIQANTSLSFDFVYRTQAAFP